MDNDVIIKYILTYYLYTRIELGNNDFRNQRTQIRRNSYVAKNQIKMPVGNTFWARENEERREKRFCCCCFPRWACQKPLQQMLFPCSFSGFLWLILVFLTRDYYACAVLGGTKESKLQNATDEEKRQIEADYANARRFAGDCTVVSWNLRYLRLCYSLSLSMLLSA